MNEHIINAVKSEISRLSAEKSGVIVAIDGRCASGKTTIAKALGASYNCNVFHMDDFFLRPEQRTPERYAEPGGNVDRERFLQEVLLPLKAGTPFSYRPFDCQTFSLKPAVDVIPANVAIVEGAYSCHPELVGYYDLTVFLTVSRDEQMKRIIERNPLSAEAFKSKWIPLEETYFEAFDIANTCNLKYLNEESVRMTFKAKNGAEIIEKISIDENEAIGKFVNLNHALVVVKIENDYLLGWHKWRSDWETFGGLIEEGESLRECITRECEEELGISNVNFEYLGIVHYNMPPSYWVKDWHEEYGGLYGITLSRDTIQIIEEKRQDKDEIGEIGLYSELKAREENIDEINEKLLEFY